jgi:UDPglucose--hexose-1-phosphate uridylyltransferase
LPNPHRRRNPLTDEWVLVSPQRVERPWQGQVEDSVPAFVPRHDPNCYLCPDSSRVNGQRNPAYTGPWVMDNDFPALYDVSATSDAGYDNELFSSEPAAGVCRVLCFSERHNLTLPQMDMLGIVALIDAWCGQYRELGERFECVQVFENKGAINGCSNPHPHGQIWASNSQPTLIQKEDAEQREYFRRNGTRMLLDYAQRELESGDRVVCANDHWLAVVPWWAAWPFETLLLPLSEVARMTELAEFQRIALALILQELTVRYDNLFQTSFPYSMGWHSAPGMHESEAHWQLHAHFFPPLLRSATVKKFMVGYEMLAEPQRDLTPEHAAARLRELPTVHYLCAASE